MIDGSSWPQFVPNLLSFRLECVARRLEGGDGVLVLQRDSDVIEAVQQPSLDERVTAVRCCAPAQKAQTESGMGMFKYRSVTSDDLNP